MGVEFLSIGSVISDTIGGISLKILVFGPQVHTLSSNERTAKLQKKRMDIRERLEELGHEVRYAEDIVDPNISGPTGNAFFQEIFIMREYDMIVTLVDSAGSIVEATLIAREPLLARKASLFLDAEYRDGLVGTACHNAETLGAHYQLYEYPRDLDDCHLLGFVKTRVESFQMMKYLL